MSYCYIEAPNYVELPRQPSIFLGGGISGCEDWQARATNILQRIEDITVVNPRRKDYNPNGGFDLVREQIRWEHHYLDKVHQVLFWFSSETIQPIVLFELGARLREYKWRRNQNPIPDNLRPQPLFIGVDPDYARKWDVFIQSSLEISPGTIHSNLDSMLIEVTEFNTMYRRLHDVR